MSNISQSDRVLLIGLDSATFSIIQPLLDKGSLPNLSRLISEGAYGILKSVIPIGTPAGWSSVVTGTNPGKHGIFDFLRREEGSYRMIPSNATFRSTPALWDYISSHKKLVGVVNVPFTYPPHPVNGFMLAWGNLSPRGAKNIAYPPELLKEIFENIGDLKTHIDEVMSAGNESTYLKDLYETTNSTVQTCKYLIKRKAWDFFQTVIYETDAVQHAFWQYADANHPRYLSSEFRSAIEDFYIYVDRVLGEILVEIGDQVNVIVLSDHGARKLSRWLHLGAFLVSSGYLKFKRKPTSAFKLACFKLGLNPLNAYKLLAALRQAKNSKKHKPGDVYSLLRKLFLSLDDVDWSRTRAYPLPGFGEINLNIKGREPNGILEGEQIEGEKRKLIAHLKSLRDPVTEATLLGGVYRKEEIYNGPSLEKAPDILLVGADDCTVFSDYEFASNSVVTDTFGTSGAHDEDGIIIMKGPSIRKGCRIVGTTLVDVAPTVLYLLGLPVPSIMDGKVLTDALTEEILSERRILTEESEEQVGPQRPYSKLEEEEVKDTLRKLGYLM